MVWAKIDDAILDNPKIARVGVLGFALHVAGIAYCCRNLTDGLIPFGKVECLLDMGSLIQDVLGAFEDQGVPAGVVERANDGLFDLGRLMAEPIAERLAECGLWERTEGGYLVHDFLEYNPSREEHLKDKMSKSDAGKRGAHKRWKSKDSPEIQPGHNGRTHGTCHGNSMAEPMAPAMAPPIAERWQNDAPDPDPIPNTNKETQPSVEQRKSESKRGTRVPESGASPEAVGEWLAKWGIAATEPALETFLDYWRGCAGQKGVKLDWGATWRNWKRNDEKRAVSQTRLRAVPIQEEPASGRSWKLPVGAT